jgi:hypothetical protein
MSIRKRSLLSVLLLLLVACAWLRPLDDAAAAHTDAGLKRALASFAAARALNAVISVAQGTEVAVQPAGVGVTFTPGQVLDPINDLVEQFSTLMLAASVSFGVQRALIGVGAWWGAALLLSVVALGWIGLHWAGRAPPAALTWLLCTLVLLRFAVPLVALGSDAGFRLFLAEDYAAGQARIERSADEFTRLAAPTDPARPDEGVAERLRRWWAQNADVAARFDEMKQVAARTVEQVIKLIVVFLLQTLVLPLLLLWALWRAARWLTGWAIGGR